MAESKEIEALRLLQASSCWAKSCVCHSLPCACAESLAALSQARPTTEANMRAFGASDAACYKWPDDTVEHKALRAAYCEGAYDSRPAADRAEIVEECARIADSMFEYYSEKHLADIDQKNLAEAWSIGMASASKIAAAIRTLSSEAGKKEREYDPNVVPCDDAEFGIKP